MENDLMSYSEAADMLGLKLGTLYSLVAQQRVPHIRLGPRLVRFSRAALRDWIQARLVLPSAEEPTDPRDT